MGKTFYRDLNIGDEAVDRVIDIYKKCGFPSKKIKGEFDYYDIESYSSDYGKFFTEVKYDLMHSKTGNFAFEVFKPKKNQKSGLYITVADIWAHVTRENVYLGLVHDIVSFLESSDLCTRKFGVGDGNADILLIKADEIIEKVMFSVSCENILFSKSIINGLLERKW